MLLFHVGRNYIAKGNLNSIKSDYRALRAVVKVMGANVEFFSILLMRGKCEEKSTDRTGK